MAWTYAKLLREIDREQLPRGAFEEFMQRRAEAYDYLMQAICEHSLNERQAGHAVKLLWNLRVYKDWDEQNRFYDLVVQWSNDDQLNVRNEAVVALISLTHQRKLLQIDDEDKEKESQTAITVAKRAIEMGLKPSREQWLKGALAQTDND